LFGGFVLGDGKSDFTHEGIVFEVVIEDVDDSGDRNLLMIVIVM